MKRIALILAVALVLSIGGQALAQKGGGHDKRPLEKLELAKLWKLTEFLELDEGRAAKLFPLLSGYDRKIAEKTGEKFEIMKKLKAHFDDVAQIPENELVKMSKRLWEIDKEVAQLQAERFDAVSKILSPEETAKYSAFEIIFKEEVRKLLMRGRRQHRGGPAVPPPQPQMQPMPGQGE